MGSPGRMTLASVLVVPILLSCHREPAPLPSAPANLLLMTLDTTRADQLGCYGGMASTPGLDSLAADSLVFDNLFSVAFGTTPSHASLFSSLYASQHGVHDNSTPLMARFETLAEVLQRSGYRTAAFVSSAPIRASLGFEQGFDHFGESFLDAMPERRAQATVDAYFGWLSQQEGDSSLFAWIHFYDPHQPYDPPEPFAPKVDGSEVHSLFLDENGVPRFLFPEDLEGSSDSWVQEVDRAARLRYRGEIDYLDSQIARVMSDLKARGLYEDTLILVVSDHGESFLADGFRVAFRHQELRGSVSKLVGILKMPGNRKAGSRISELAGNVDLAPTLLGMLGKKAENAWQGRSLLPWIEDELAGKRSFRESLVLEGSDPPLVAIRSLDWAYVEPRPGAELEVDLDSELSHQLYDLRRDPSEAENIYSQRPEIVAQMRDPLLGFLTSVPSVASDPLEDKEHEEKLQSLGYLE